MNVGEIIRDPGIPLKPEFVGTGATASAFISQVFVVLIFLSTFLAFFWLVWGAFQYLTAGGNKERLAQARARITWALVGLVFIMLAYFVAQFAQQIILPVTAPVPGTPLQ